MGDGMDDLFPRQELLQVVDVLAGRLDVTVLGFRNVPCQDVNLAVVAGEEGGDFFADEDIWLIGDLQASTDFVVISESDQVHSFALEGPVEPQGLAGAIGKMNLPQQPFGTASGMLGMKMEVAAHGDQ